MKQTFELLCIFEMNVLKTTPRPSKDMIGIHAML